MYIDPNARDADTQTTSPSSAPGGMAGSSLNDVIAAAGSGNLRVDQATGAATIQAIAAVREQVDALRRLASADGGTRLGGGYAERVDQFNREWTVAGPGSALEVMAQFSDQLHRLGEAVRQSMTAYEASDDNAALHVTRAGKAL